MYHLNIIYDKKRYIVKYYRTKFHQNQPYVTHITFTYWLWGNIVNTTTSQILPLRIIPRSNLRELTCETQNNLYNRRT